MSAIQRDGDVTGLGGLAASLTTLEGAYAFHGQATAKGPGRDASELQALIWNLVQVLAKLERRN